MVETDAPSGLASADGEGEWAKPLTPFDTANYVYQLSREMAGLANGAGLARVAAALELARDLAAEAMTTHAKGEA
jgi:hypothetical protein